MKQFTFKPWLMALFIAAICLCTVLPGLYVRASEFSPYGSESYLATQEVSFSSQSENVSYAQYSDEYPQFQYSPQHIIGDKGEQIAFEVPLVQAGFLEGKSAQLQFQVSLDDDSGFAMYGADGTTLTRNENGQYVYPIASLASGSYAFSVSSSADCKGLLQAWMYDGEGNSLSISADQYPIAIPANYSLDDLSVLKAIADANSENEQLKELYYNEGYKTSSNVTWDYYQTPYRLTYLEINDYQKHAITNLDLSGLDALSNLYISGAKNLTSLDLSALTQLQNVSLYGNGLRWENVTLSPSVASLWGYTNVDIQGNMGPIYAKAGVETTIDLSQYIKQYGSDCTFTWKEQAENSYDENDTEAVTADTAQPGVFHLTGVDGYTYYCLINHANYKDWCLRAADIKVTGSGSAEVKFNYEPSPVSYTSIDNYNNQGDADANFSISDMPSSDFKVRVQLTDSQNQNGTWFTANNETLSLSEGGCWLPASAVYEQGYNRYGFYFNVYSTNEAEVGYTVSIYASEDLSATPLATSSEKKVVFINSDNYPRVGNLPRLSGELNTEIPLTFSIQPNYLLGKPAKVRIYFNLSSWNYENLSVTGNGWARSEFTNVYEFTTPNLQASQFTLSVIANAAVSGRYSVHLTDGDGNDIGYTSSDAVVQIPLNLSETDKQALIALRDANEMSNDLYNFIEKGIYLKDTEQGSSSQNVGVKWNSEFPGRVEMFFIKDDQSRAVTSLNLKPLTALKKIYIRGTNLSKLDLSGLTLRELSLWNTKLKWDDVILPNWDNNWHNLNGDTWIQIGTPLNDYNSVAANGTEIDLSEYAVINGVPSTFTWYKNTTDYEYEQTTPMDSTGAGKFILSGKPGEQFYCSIQNANYGNWTMSTSYVKIQRSASDFNAQDTLGLRKLANDNPNVAVLKEFVDSKGWEIDNWNNWQDQVRTQWDSNNRLTHLCIELDWGQDPDTISTLDLSAFTELKHFECERWLNIKELDLTNNTKLEHLHLFSNNLQRIDASMCTNLQVFKFATEDMREGSYAYDECSLSSLSLPSSLKLLRIEHAHIGSFDFGQFPNLVSLHIGNCQALQPLNLNQLKKLETVELPLTTQFGDWIKTLPTTVTALWIQDTEYAMPDATLLSRLKQFGVPKGITRLDLSTMPKLEVIGWEGNDIRYSTVQNWKKELKIGVVYRTSLSSTSRWSISSNIQLQSPSHPNTSLFENGDTIDLSSEAVINGVKSTFLWVNTKYNTEETEALQEVPGKPGVFVLNSKEEKYGSYRCLIMNEQFCDITPINESRGWRMETNRIRVNTEVPTTYHEGDVQALGRLVSNANNPELNEWWSSNAWQTDEHVHNAQAIWNNENPRRLTCLWLNTSVGASADLSAFDKLELLSLTYYNKELTEVKLPTETQNLQGLMLEGNQALTSLIVAPYSNLNHLNVNSTGLTACDVSQNKQLTELFMQWTKIQSVEETAPEIAKQLTSYGVSDVTKSIDLDSFPALKQFYPSMYMRYSDVKHPRQMEWAGCSTFAFAPSNTYHPAYTSYGGVMDVSTMAKEDSVSNAPAWIIWNEETSKEDTLAVTGFSYPIGDELKPETRLDAEVTNSLFPGWTLRYYTYIYTTDGDVNLDRKVNVQDVTGMVSYMLGQWPWEKLQFGSAESNTNHDSHYGEAADLVGIVNIILDEPITKGEALRAAYVPQVEMSLDAQNMLHIDAESPIAALYMEFAGATQELPLLNQAARLNQSCSLKDDTLRVVAYSLDGKTIDKGAHALMQMLPGMQLVKASFSDAHAVPMELKGDYMPTANEVIAPISDTKAVYNYPNPAKGSTTFCYTLNEAVQQVEIQLFASNGAMMARLQGLSAEQGRHEETVNLPFASGVYYYRLVVDGKQVIATNTLIIK